MTFHAYRDTRARGSKPGACTSPRIAISFDEATFRHLTDEALRLRVPVSEVVRQKVKVGIWVDSGEAQP